MKGVGVMQSYHQEELLLNLRAMANHVGKLGTTPTPSKTLRDDFSKLQSTSQILGLAFEYAYKL